MKNTKRDRRMVFASILFLQGGTTLFDGIFPTKHPFLIGGGMVLVGIVMFLIDGYHITKEQNEKKRQRASEPVAASIWRFGNK